MCMYTNTIIHTYVHPHTVHIKYIPTFAHTCTQTHTYTHIYTHPHTYMVQFKATLRSFEADSLVTRKLITQLTF